MLVHLSHLGSLLIQSHLRNLLLDLSESLRGLVVSHGSDSWVAMKRLLVKWLALRGDRLKLRRLGNHLLHLLLLERLRHELRLLVVLLRHLILLLLSHLLRIGLLADGLVNTLRDIVSPNDRSWFPHAVFGLDLPLRLWLKLSLDCKTHVHHLSLSLVHLLIRIGSFR